MILTIQFISVELSSDYDNSFPLSTSIFLAIINIPIQGECYKLICFQFSIFNLKRSFICV